LGEEKAFMRRVTKGGEIQGGIGALPGDLNACQCHGAPATRSRQIEILLVREVERRLEREPGCLLGLRER
jgi:hypothetical protein